MMFVDASVLVAVLAREPGWEQLFERLSRAENLAVSALARFEAVTAIARVRSGGLPVTATAIAQADSSVIDLIGDFGMVSLDLTAAVGAEAVSASARYGKIVRHPAALNLGDCFAYACAKSLGVPLLYKGNDFARTDLA